MRIDLVAVELEKIRKRHGGVLHAKHVVEAAKAKDSPLHNKFEWDDGRAAQAYRLWQARELIVNVTLECGKLGKQIITTKYVSLPSDRSNGGGYRALVEVIKDDDRRAELFESMLNDCKIFRTKYAEVKQAAKILAAMDELVAA